MIPDLETLRKGDVESPLLFEDKVGTLLMIDLSLASIREIAAERGDAWRDYVIVPDPQKGAWYICSRDGTPLVACYEENAK